MKKPKLPKATLRVDDADGNPVAVTKLDPPNLRLPGVGQKLIAASSLGTPGVVAVRRKSGMALTAALDRLGEEALEGVHQELREKIAESVGPYDMSIACMIREGKFG